MRCLRMWACVQSASQPASLPECPPAIHPPTQLTASSARSVESKRLSRSSPRECSSGLTSAFSYLCGTQCGDERVGGRVGVVVAVWWFPGRGG